MKKVVEALQNLYLKLGGESTAGGTVSEAIDSIADVMAGGDSGGGESGSDTSGSDIYKVTMTGSLASNNPQTDVSFDKTPDEMRQAALDGKLVWLFHKYGTTTNAYCLESSNTYQGGIQLNFFCSIGSKEYHIMITTRYTGDSGTVYYYTYNYSLSNS